jgi:hypothetical protein
MEFRQLSGIPRIRFVKGAADARTTVDEFRKSLFLPIFFAFQSTGKRFFHYDVFAHIIENRTYGIPRQHFYWIT